MVRTDIVVASSHHVKLAFATCVVATATVLFGFQALDPHLGQTSREVVTAATCRDGSCTQSAAVRRTVADLESQGLDCRAKPALTDRVVFEWRTTEVTVIDFAAALRASSSRAGWVRHYCMAA